MNHFFDLLCAPDLTASSVLVRMAVSLLLGLLVGFERQQKREGAGIRTFTLISLSCTAAMCLSIWIPQSYPHLLNGDPGRVAAQIITGVGFLGAGCIIQSKASIHGMTTAAAVWTSAIMGMCIGAGLLIPGIMLALATLFVLVVLSIFERRARLNGDIKILSITFKGADADFASIVPLIHQHHLLVLNTNISKDYVLDTTRYDLKVQALPGKSYDRFFQNLRQQAGIQSATLSNL